MRNGFKIQHGLPESAGLAVVARKTGLTQGVVLAIWVAFLDTASRNRPRGHLGTPDHEEIAALLGFDAAAVAAAFTAFHDRRMITAAGNIAGWSTKNLSSSAARTRAWRERQKQQKTAEKPRRDETADAIAQRRHRLQQDMLARHQSRGRTITHTPPEKRI